MADDYDYDGDAFLDMDDGWIYVDDEFDIADELAEGQIADPGYCGVNQEISMEGYEFDLFGYWEDLEYGDDSYWDYGLPGKDEKIGQKRKRGTEAQGPAQKGKSKKVAYDREAETVLFRSRTERNQSLYTEAPRNKEKPYAFLPDWRERFANADGLVNTQNMPEAMKRAAEAQDEELNEEDMDESGEAGDWEDEADDEEGGLALDPDMLKTILREKLGAAGLDGMDEAAFMQTIQKMMSGEGGGDAADELANALLGKVTSEGGDEAVSGWLSQQGVSLEEDDDASSVATADLPQGPRGVARGQHQSPPDSAISMPERPLAGATTQPSSHLSRKRGADTEKPEKTPKKVKFDDPGSESTSAQGAADPPECEDDPPTNSKPTKSKKANSTATKANGAASDSSAPTSRKRKATSEESEQQKPAVKKTRSRELQQLGPLPEAPSPAPPAKRTRSAKTKGGK